MTVVMDIAKKQVNPIGIKRLEARPVATLCLEAQEMHEKKEKKIN